MFHYVALKHLEVIQRLFLTSIWIWGRFGLSPGKAQKKIPVHFPLRGALLSEITLAASAAALMVWFGADAGASWSIFSLSLSLKSVCPSVRPTLNLLRISPTR